MSLLYGILSLNLQTFLVFLTAFLCLFNYVKKQSWKNLPPGPPCLPIVGSLPFLSSRDLRQSMKTLQRKYGNIFTVHLGCAQVVFINGYDAIEEALRTRGAEFGERPDMYIINEIFQRRGVIGSAGDLWKEHKRFSLNVLRTLGMGKSLLEEKIHDEVVHSLKEIDSLNGLPSNPKRLFNSVTFNIIGMLVSGKRMDYHSNEFKALMNAWDYRLEWAGQLNTNLHLFPFLRYLPWVTSKAAKVQQCMAEINQKHLRWIEEHIEKLSEEPNNLIDAYIKMIAEERGNEDSTFTECQMLQIINDLYGGGTSTTTTTMCWAIIFLLNHPEVLQRCQAEIDSKLGNRHLPSMQDKLKMPYMDATLKEILRLGDIAPFSMPHATREDVDFRGFHLPKGTTIFPNLNSVHTDDRYFPNPDRFDPGRFLNEDGSVKGIKQLIPFAIGPRLCMGEGLVRMQLFIFLTALLQHFTPTMPEGHKPPSVSGSLNITREPDSFEVIFVKRY